MPELTPYNDVPTPPEDPQTVAYEHFQESDEYREAIAAIRDQKVDEVDMDNFLRRPISLQDVLGEDAATDIAAEGILLGFWAGFKYGARGGQGRVSD